MAHESFEDPASAAVMNELFVNIKVDREERPDLDRIYQLAHQMLTQRGGGWPLTMFLSPGTQRPFFGGTYFPKEPRYGMPAFTDLLRRVSEFYRTHREDIAQQSEALQQAFARDVAARRARRRAADARTARHRARAARRGVRCAVRRLRLGAEVSASDQHRLPAAPMARDRGQRCAGPAFAVHGDADAASAWPKAASTTSSAAASRATRSTSTG